MSLTSGSKLGHYEIIAPLGAGAMGEVYRARDPRLGRDVALKILPPAFATDAGRQARFEQEARAAAALNHPNIVGVFDIGAAEGSFYIVSELVSGETLATLLESGPLPIKKLLDIATQIADGMAAAHATRITHRDLKPANIMIAEDGRAKILDFGLARQASAAAAASDATTTIQQTTAGMIVGTVNYMSPEQARGKEVDTRSDQFSFGLILYEMASGKRAFDRPEAVQVMSAILTEDAPPLDPKIPPPLRWTIERCLAKEPRDRYESSRDLFQELRYLRDHLAEATLTSSIAIAPVAPARQRAPWKIPAAFAAGILCALALMILRPGPQGSDPSTYRFTPFSFESGGQLNPVWSPDGKAVAYSASRGREPYQVYLRYLDSATPVQLTHTAENAVVRNWSADGKHVLFVRAGLKPYGLWSVAAVGGDPEFSIALHTASPAEALTRDNRVRVALHKGPDARYGLWHSSPPDAPEKKYSPDPFTTPLVINNPQVGFSPDGKQILLYMNGARRREEAWLMPFPPQPAHPPRRVFTTIDTFNSTPSFSWMPDNRHVVLALAPAEGATQLWMADTRSEERHAITSGTESRGAPAVAPDGSKLIYSQGSASTDIVSVDLATAALRPLIAIERFQAMPAWAAKAPLMAYTTDRNGPTEIWLHDGNSERPLFSSQASSRAANGNKWLMGPAPSPDGSRVIYTLIDHATGSFALWMAAVSGGAPLRLTNESSATEEPGSWSPDGAWYVYQALHSGNEDLMKVKTSGEAAPVLLHADVHRTSAAVPVWSPSGEWIVYTDHGYKLISPDGAKTRDLGELAAVAVSFSADGKLLYGIRKDGDRYPLFSVDIASSAEKVIGDVGADKVPRSPLNPAVRLSLSPDGKSITYGTSNSKINMWMLEGFNAKRSWW
jgi:serine/threonine protein kinase/Tol biopolymer transport system component